MNSVQNPHKQVGYLQQCLSGDKKPLGLFLGAGCPMSIRLGKKQSPLIPDIAGITKVVCDKLSKSKECGPLLKIIEDHFKKDARNDTTVEDILSHIRALRAVAGKDEVRGMSAANLDKLDEQICSIIHELADKSLPCATILADQDTLRSLYVPDYLLLVKRPEDVVAKVRRVAEYNVPLAARARKSLGAWKVYEKDAREGRAPGLKAKGFDKLRIERGQISTSELIGEVPQQTTNQTAAGVPQIQGSGKTNDLGTAGNDGKP